MLTPSKAQWNNSSATPSSAGPNGSYRQILGVNFIIKAVWAMFDPIMPAAPTIVSFSLVRKFIIVYLGNRISVFEICRKDNTNIPIKVNLNQTF